MTAHAPVAHIYLRLFEPRAFSFAAPMFGAPALLKLPPAPPCALCEARTVPALMGWTEIFGDVRTLIVCSECADGAEADLEHRLYEKLGLTPAPAVAAE